MNNQTNPWLSRTQAAEYLGVNVRTIDGYIKRHLITAYKPKGARLTRILRADLDAFLANHPKVPAATVILSP